MSKVAMPRPRYIAARIDSPRDVPRRAFTQALAAAARDAGLAGEAVPQLTRYGDGHAIVRADHKHERAARLLLPLITHVADGGARWAVQVATLSTAGTLRALTDRIGVLRERAPR